MALSTMQAKQIHSLAYKLMYDNANRNVALEAYMSMYKSGWDLPPEVRGLPWIQKVINSDPFDAIQTGVRILATIPLSIRYQPLLGGELNRQRAEVIEKVLKWQIANANRRRAKTIEAELAKQSLLFEFVTAKTVDVEWELERRKSIAGETKRLEQYRELGRFKIVPYDGRSIFPLWSDGLLEGVLVVQHRRAMDVLNDWGDRARQFPDLEKLAYAQYGTDWVTYYEWQDYRDTMVWARPGQQWGYPNSNDIEHWVLDSGETPTPFLPWTVLGGSELETDSAHKHVPLLYPVYATGAWDIKNIVQTLGVSEVIAHSGAPRYVEEGPNQQQAMIDYGEPERIAKMPAGNILKPLPPPMLDNALQAVEAMMSAQIDKSTVARILQGGDIPSGTAFATLNLATQTAVGVLSPFKDLTQKALAHICTTMLKWVAHTDKDLTGYSMDRETMGEQARINADEVEPQSIYIDVILHPDTPTDKQQKINSAAIAVAQLDMSIETALDEIGIEDPRAEMRKRMFEKLAQHELDLQFQREIMEMQQELQLQAEQASMAMQMEMQQAMQPQEPAFQQPNMGGPPQGLPDEAGFATGQGFNPAMGGGPPAGAAPLANAEGAGNPEQMLGGGSGF